MPRFEPFPGLRYDPERVRLDQVVAPPYDVISPDEQVALRAQSPYNSVRIELPDAAPGLDPYQAAAARISKWQDEGILRRDPEASLYGYRMSYEDVAGRPGQTVGVIGALGLEPPGMGIFPHERTTPKAKSDRLQLLQTTGLNTSPIWVLSLATGLSDELTPPDDLDGVVDADGVRHEIWRITDPGALRRITEAIGGAPVVIADGHHRFETALTYQEQRRAGEAARPRTGGSRGGAGHAYDSVLALVVELSADQLSVQGIHRLIRAVPTDVDLVATMARYFDLTPTDPPDATLVERMQQTGAMALVTPAGTWLMRATTATEAEAGHDLDSSRLEVALAGLGEPDVVYQHGWDLAASAVARGDAQAAVLLRPVTVDQIAATGQGGERMPPKTTFFWPKPRTGFVFREVTD